MKKILTIFGAVSLIISASLSTISYRIKPESVTQLQEHKTIKSKTAPKTSEELDKSQSSNDEENKKEEKQLINVKDLGIYPNTFVDYSDKLKEAFIESENQKKGLFFDPGFYNFKENYISLRNYNSIIGSTLDAVVFNSINVDNKILTIGNEKYYDEVKNITIKNIIFNNINIKISGNRKKNINIINNAFINTNDPGYQLSVSHISSNIIGNVFMRGKNFKGKSLSTYAARNTLIQHNFWGSFFDIDDAKFMLPNAVINLIIKVNNLKNNKKIILTNDQGFFITAYNVTSAAKKIIFKDNYIHGNEYDNYFRDHLIYIKMYDSIKLIGNYFRGWPNSAQGHVKIRNTKNTIICGNYFYKNTQLATFVYDNVEKKEDMCLINTYIYNNYFNESKSYFYMNFIQGENNNFANVKNYLVFKNIYSLSEKYLTQINGTWRIKNYVEFKEQNNFTRNGTGKVQSIYFTKINTQDENLINYLSEEDKELINYPVPLFFLS